MTDLREMIARQLCAEGGSSGFCSCVGQYQGCKVGSGEPPEWQRCKATNEQLYVSGYLETADNVMGLVSQAGVLA